MSCVDVIAVRQSDGTLKSSPFFVRFTNKAVRTQLVRIYLNGEKFNPQMTEEKQFVLEKDHQYAYFRPWAFVKRHQQLSNLRLRHLNRYQVRSTGTPNSPTTAFSTSDYIRSSRLFAKSMPVLTGTIPATSKKQLTLEDFQKMMSDTNSDDQQSTVSSASSPSSVSSPQIEEVPKHEQQQEQQEEQGKSEKIQHRPISIHIQTKSSPIPASLSTPTDDDEFKTPETPISPATSTPTSSTTTNTKGFFDNWLETIDNEAHSYDKLVPSDIFLQEMMMNLKSEMTKITYEMNGEKIEGRIFLWDWRDKVVVSDVDGTITKSDVLGQIFTRLGKDYTHPGIPSLFTKIVDRGYRIIYLTARPITDSQLTRTYIENVKQGKYVMPQAPVITTPNSTWSAIAREVIIRRPETYKIAILSFIKELFAPDCFLAGWGNRPTDCLSYTTVGIDPSMSFRVNSKGEIVVHNTKAYFSSHQHFESRLDRLNLFPWTKGTPFRKHSKRMVQPIENANSSHNSSDSAAATPQSTPLDSPITVDQQETESLLDLHFSPDQDKETAKAEEEVEALVREENATGEPK